MTKIIGSIPSQYPIENHSKKLSRMKLLLLFVILLGNFVNGEQIFDGQAEMALEKALDDIRLGVTTSQVATTILPPIRRPIPPMAPPRASSVEQTGNILTNSTPHPKSAPPPILPPFAVLINPPPPHPNSAPLANFVVRPNEPKRAHKFEFMPHFDKENYDFMVPEGGKMEEDTLVAVLTFFGLLDREMPKFVIKSDRLGWFGIGDVQTTQETNYALSEVPILRRANAKINWTEIEGDDGIYKFQVNGVQGQMNASAQIRVEILPLQNYTHLEMEPPTTTIGGDVDLGGVEKEEEGKAGEDLLEKEEMDEELLKMDPLGIIDVDGGDETEAADELFGGGQNATIRIHLEGKQSRKGQIEVEFAELSTLMNNPVPNLVVDYEGNEAMDLVKSVVRLELRPANPFLDIRPHYIAFGDQAHLWIMDPIKVAELAKGNGGEWRQQFRLFVHQMEGGEQPMIGGNGSTSIFSGSLLVNGGANPSEGIKFAAEEFEFSVNEEAKNGQVLGKLEMEKGKNDGQIAFSLYGQGAELFRIDEMGVLRLDCRQNASSPSSNDSPNRISDQCLDRESGGTSSFYFVASASAINSSAQNLVAPVPITIRLDDANDNPPRLEIFNRLEMLSILDGQMEGGPLVVAIRDADSSPENRENRLWLRGNCSKFFAIQPLKNSSSFYSPLFAINFAPESEILKEGENCENLELIAGDQHGQMDRREFKINFKIVQRRFRFVNSIYERSINADKLHTGFPIVQMQLANHPNREMTLNYAIIGGNPGWLAMEPFTGNVFVSEMPKNELLGKNVFSVKVAAIQNHIKLAESLLKLEILANSAPVNSFIKFPLPLMQMELDRLEEFEQEPKGLSTIWMPIFGDSELAGQAQLEEIEAWDDFGRPIQLGIRPSLDYSPQNGSIQLNLSLLRPVRSLHAQFKLAQGQKEEARMLLAITFRSDPAKTEQHRRALARPHFVAPWVDEETQIGIKIAEELPIGHPFLRLPAFNPLNGNPAQIHLEGPDANSFIFDNETGELRIGSRLDFESSARFQQIFLVANSPESDRPVRAQIQIELVDVDDVPPKIRIESAAKIGGIGEGIVGIELEENAPKNKQLAILELEDPDSRKQNCELVGKEADKFALEPIKQKSGKRQWRLATGQNGDAELDRERVARIGLVIRCVDFPGQNRAEMPLLLVILDQNDNRPQISWAHQDQPHIEVAARDWPKGAKITRFWAKDQDIGENGRVQFQLGQGGLAREFFQIDPENGELSATNEGEEERPLAKLAKMLAGQMLELEVTARDNGRPALSSSAKLRILLEEEGGGGNEEGKGELRLTWPSNEGEMAAIEVGEDTPVGRKIGKAEAVWRGIGGGNEIFFRIGNAEDGGEEMVRIEERSGEIFTASKFDYESRKHWTFLVTAFSLNGQESNGIFDLNVLNVDEYWPQFPHNLEPPSAKQILYWPSNINSEMFLGQVEAFDPDAAPFNRIVYSLMPKCSHPAHLFSPDPNGPPAIRVHPQNGDIHATIGFPPNISSVQLCILASPADHPPPLDDSFPAQSLLRLQLLPPTPTFSPSPKKSTFPANNSHIILEHRLALQRIPSPPFPNNKSASPNFFLHSVIFTPYGQSSSAAQKIGSLEAMGTLIGIEPSGGELRFDPAILGALGEGFYEFGLKMGGEALGPRGILNRNVHFVEEKHRLRLLFNESIDAVGGNLSKIIREFEGILGERNQKSEIRVIYSEPAKDADRPMFRSSMCFHLWSPADSILGLDQTIRLVSTNIPGQKSNNEQLDAFYERNAVVNVEPCLDSPSNRPPPSPSSTLLLNARSKEWLFWSCFGGISLLAIFGFCGYFCFVRTYREHLRRKSGDLLPAADERSADSSPFHQYLNNQCSSASVFSVPEFIHAKTLMFV